MPNPPKHLKFTLNAATACAGKTPKLRMTAAPDLLAKNGARQVPARAHPSAPRDLSGVPSRKQSRILTYPELKSLKGIFYCRQSLARLEKKGEFPRRIPISAGRIGWYEHEIDEWVQSKAEA